VVEQEELSVLEYNLPTLVLVAELGYGLPFPLSVKFGSLMAHSVASPTQV
jgi:hypothetical protein